jgi:hypothetical protein
MYVNSFFLFLRNAYVRTNEESSFAFTTMEGPEATTAQIEMQMQMMRQEWERVKRDPSSRLSLSFPGRAQCIMCRQLMENVRGFLVLGPVLKNVVVQGLLGVQNGCLLLTAMRENRVEKA